jgi:hypothetical protein
MCSELTSLTAIITQQIKKIEDTISHQLYKKFKIYAINAPRVVRERRTHVRHVPNCGMKVAPAPYEERA